MACRCPTCNNCSQFRRTLASYTYLRNNAMNFSQCGNLVKTVLAIICDNFNDCFFLIYDLLRSFYIILFPMLLKFSHFSVQFSYFEQVLLEMFGIFAFIKQYYRTSFVFCTNEKNVNEKKSSSNYMYTYDIFYTIYGFWFSYFITINVFYAWKCELNNWDEKV